VIGEGCRGLPLRRKGIEAQLRGCFFDLLDSGTLHAWHYTPCSQKLTCISSRLVPVRNMLFDAEVGVLPARIIGAIWQPPRGGNEANRVLAQNRLHRLTALFKDIRVSSFSDTLWRLMQPRGAQNGIDKERGAALRGSSRAGRCSSQCHGGAQRQMVVLFFTCSDHVVGT
jgi:hypothetical protein